MRTLTLDSFLGTLRRPHLQTAAAAAERRDRRAIWVSESNSDSFLSAQTALDATTTPLVGTAITLALSRSPMTVAYAVNDLVEQSNGRFVLGLGTGARDQVDGRFDMPFSAPAARMGEYILALKAIWSAWHSGDALDFRGDFYSFTSMERIYRPPSHTFEPRVFLASVGPRVTEVAGALADGIILHPLTSRETFARSILPPLERGAASTGRRVEDIEILLPAMVSFRDSPDFQTHVDTIRTRLAWYGSRAQYAPLFIGCGLGELADELQRWRADGEDPRAVPTVDMAALEMLTISCASADLRATVEERFDGRIDRLALIQDWLADDPDADWRVTQTFA
jgi:probable F420-dependent oxidoreductase